MDTLQKLRMREARNVDEAHRVAGLSKARASRRARLLVEHGALCVVQRSKAVALGILNGAAAMEIFDGAMVSDGSLSLLREGAVNAQFGIGQTGWKRIDWLVSIWAALGVLNVACPLPKCTMKKYANGEPYELCYLISRSSPFLTQQYKRWYHNGMKIVPEDFRLTPTVLAHWFMGDGNSYWGYSNPEYGVTARLGTCGFDEECVEILESQLRRLGLIYISRGYYKGIQKGAGIGITILGGSVEAFMDMIEPYVFPAYMYRIKRPGRKACTRRAKDGVQCNTS